MPRRRGHRRQLPLDHPNRHDAQRRRTRQTCPTPLPTAEPTPDHSLCSTGATCWPHSGATRSSTTVSSPTGTYRTRTPTPEEVANFDWIAHRADVERVANQFDAADPEHRRVPQRWRQAHHRPGHHRHARAALGDRPLLRESCRPLWRTPPQQGPLLRPARLRPRQRCLQPVVRLADCARRVGHQRRTSAKPGRLRRQPRHRRPLDAAVRVPRVAPLQRQRRSQRWRRATHASTIEGTASRTRRSPISARPTRPRTRRRAYRPTEPAGEDHDSTDIAHRCCACGGIVDCRRVR